MIDKKYLSEFRKKSSSDAADFIINSYPLDCEEYYLAFELIRSKTWDKSDQLKLSKYYLQKIPYSNSKVYELFASIMSLKSLIKVLDEVLMGKETDKQLLFYHLKPALHKYARNIDDLQLVEDFSQKYL